MNAAYLNMEIQKKRVRKTDLKSREAISSLYETGEWSMRELAEKFGVSVPRVCQIVKEYRTE